MFAKIFQSMYDGSLVGDWKALVTFQQLLVLADRYGVVDMTTRAISRRTSIPLDIIEEGIASLEQPDPESRTPDDEGRRIVRIDEHRRWGWRVVNFQKYRQMQRHEERREYMRDYMKDRRCKQDVNTSKPCKPEKPIAEAEAEAEKGSAPAARRPGHRWGDPPAGINKQAWIEWTDYKGGKPKPQTITKLTNQLRNHPVDVQQKAVDHSISNGYAGLFPEKFKSDLSVSGKDQMKPPKDNPPNCPRERYDLLDDEKKFAAWHAWGKVLDGRKQEASRR